MGIDQNTWRWMRGAEIPFAVRWFGLLLLIPESPAWLFYRNRRDDAKSTLRKILPESEIESHLVEMQESLEKVLGNGLLWRS
jgi:hypothetical protein